MARPKKSPRSRFQITLPKSLGRELRAYAKKKDAELSQVVGEALSAYFRTTNSIPPETRAVLFSRDKPIAEKVS
jgi:hypothetical protein